MQIFCSVFACLLVCVGLAATSLPVAFSAPAPQGPDPVVAKWPHWPYPTSCGNGLTFDPVSVFSGPTEAEAGTGPAEAGHGRLPGVEEVTLKESSGEWTLGGYSGRCDPTSVVNGREAITWTLSSKQKSLRPGTRALWIDLGPGECASGRSQNARAMKPVFFELGKRLLMVMRLKPLPRGGYTCEGISEPPLQVKLPKRLGDHTLFDGGVYPPSRAVLPKNR